jgi:nitrate reductase gamma subunit
LTSAAYIAIYAGLIVFCAGCLWRIWQYARTPLHLRWELYPVPHEGPYRAAYGGSYFEAQEWWRGPQVNDRWHEWRVMAEEILLLKSLREFNRRLWLPSFLFHFGLYLAIVAGALAALAGLTAGMVAGKANAGIAGTLGVLISVVGLAAAVLVVAGACGLLVRRMADPAFKNSTRPADVFHLILFIATCALLAGGCLMPGSGQAAPGDFVRGAIHFNRGVRIGTVFGAGVILASALAAYIPFTHMAHFIAKYFAWHSVRWDDRRNERGSRMEARIAANLGYKPTWSAEHVGADGKRTWAEVAGTNPARETRK